MPQKFLKIFESGQERLYSKGQVLIYKGDAGSNFFLVKKGYVKVYDLTAKGGAKVYFVYGPGDVFPIVWTLGNIEKLYSFYEAMTDVHLLVVSRKVVRDTVEKDHGAALGLLKYITSRAGRMMRRMESIDNTNSLHKICYALIYLAETHGDRLDQGLYKLKIPITHQDLADIAGLTRETTTLQLQKFYEDNIISRSKLDIINTKKIKSYLLT